MLSHFQTEITLLVSPNTSDTFAVDAVPLPTKFQPIKKFGLEEIVVVVVLVVVVASFEVLVVELVLVLVAEDPAPEKLSLILYKSFSYELV